MKDANTLREVVEINRKTRDELLERDADRILDFCESALKTYSVPYDVKDICIYFEYISDDFSDKKHVSVCAEEKSIKEIIEENSDCEYKSYLKLEDGMERCKSKTFSGVGMINRKKFLALSANLEKRGLYCCAKMLNNKVGCFAVVLEL